MQRNQLRQPVQEVSRVGSCVSRNTITPHRRKRQYKGRLFPNGEFSYGWDNASEKPQIHAEHKRMRELYQMADRCLLRMIDTRVSHREQLYLVAFVLHGIATREEVAAEINLVSPPESSQKKSPSRRTRGITSQARRYIRNAGYLLQKEYGKSSLVFCTITIPKLPYQFRKYLNANWGDFKRTVLQAIQRRLINHGCPSTVIESTEVQERRYSTYGEVYLHSHIVWSTARINRPTRAALRSRAKGGEWQHAIPASWLRGRVHALLQKWLRAWGCQTASLDDALEEADRIPLPRVETVPVRKDVVAYLAKYLSKGSRTINTILADKGVAARELPRQWYYLGGGLRQRVAVLVRPFYTVAADFLNEQYAYPRTKEYMFDWVREVTITYNERTYRAGLCGKLSMVGVRILEKKISQDDDS